MTELFDANILVHSVDGSSPEKHRIALELVSSVFAGSSSGAVPAQALAETYRVLTKKLARPVRPSDSARYIRSFLASPFWEKLSYSAETVAAAAEFSAGDSTPFYDTLLAVTARENGIGEIVTENARDFRKFRWLKARNPFKRR